MTTNPPTTQPVSGVRHYACSSCDGEGIDPEAPACPLPGYRTCDCSDCRGTGDARCASCDEPTALLSSNHLCEECGSAEAAEAIVAAATVRRMLYGGTHPGAEAKRALAAIAIASAEWALYREEMQARAEDFARAHGMAVVDLDSLPF